MTKLTFAAMVTGVGLCVTAATVRARGAGTGQAPDAAAHKTWMDDAADAQEDLRDAIHAKKGADAARAAVKIEDLMAKTETYWAGKHASDIVKIAQGSRALATEVAADARTGKWAQADAAFGKMNARCNACHDLHPEKR
jgi:hypothetical protein